jgi:hypothetical protein
MNEAQDVRTEGVCCDDHHAPRGKVA